MLTAHSISRRAAMFTLAAPALSRAGEPAPKFFARTMDGERFTNDSLKGKVVLLQFWATWCQYCRRDQSAVDALIDDFGSQGFIVLAIDMGESKKKVKQYLEDSPRSCRVVLMEDTNLAAIYAARSYPFYVLIDRDGNVAGTQRGAAGEDALRHLVRRAGLDAE